jgi:hypothetical protein
VPVTGHAGCVCGGVVAGPEQELEFMFPGVVDAGVRGEGVADIPDAELEDYFFLGGVVGSQVGCVAEV